MGFAVEVQRAVYDRLNGAMSCAVRDAVPQPANSTDGFPYVTIGDTTDVQWDTDTETGADTTLTIHTWSRERGMGECKAIQGELYELLHRYTPTVLGYEALGIDFERAEVFLDADAETRHGVSVFRITVEKGQPLVGFFDNALLV